MVIFYNRILRKEVPTYSTKYCISLHLILDLSHTVDHEGIPMWWQYDGIKLSKMPTLYWMWSGGRVSELWCHFEVSLGQKKLRIALMMYCDVYTCFASSCSERERESWRINEKLALLSYVVFAIISKQGWDNCLIARSSLTSQI